MEVKINGMPKEIADFLKEIENRPMYSKPTAHTHSMPSVNHDTYCHIVLTPNSDEDEGRNGMKKRKQKKVFCWEQKTLRVIQSGFRLKFPMVTPTI